MSNSKFLVLNAGSSSIKFSIFDNDLKLLAKGLCERIFVDGIFELNIIVDDQYKKIKKNVEFTDHQIALQYILNQLIENKIVEKLTDIIGVGHRIVQGGNYFKDSAIINESNLVKIYELSKLAPLHNVHEANVIKIIMNLIPNSKNIAVFDTTFHSTIPPKNYRYAISPEWENKYMVRRYGMHGISYQYVTEKMQNYLNKQNANFIICHLGNGASICAIKEGKSYNTSMGFTPLEGLIMGTRSGDIDPAVIDYLCDELHQSVKEITNALNKKSGMLALTNSSDMRDIFKNEQNNQIAIDMYCQRIANYIVNYVNQLNGEIDGIIFTAGVGENSPEVIKRVIQLLPILNLEYDLNFLINLDYNDIKAIHTNNSKYKIFQIRTNEELMIAKNVKCLV